MMKPDDDDNTPFIVMLAIGVVILVGAFVLTREEIIRIRNLGCGDDQWPSVWRRQLIELCDIALAAMEDSMKSVDLNIPHSAEEREEQRLIGGWDRWYASLPEDLKRKLSIYDFKRLGDCFREAFNIPRQVKP